MVQPSAESGSQCESLHLNAWRQAAWAVRQMMTYSSFLYVVGCTRLGLAVGAGSDSMFDFCRVILHIPW